MENGIMQDKNVSPTVGIFLLCIIGGMGYVLFVQDAMFIVFLIPMLIFLILSLFQGGKDVEENLESIGWGDRNIYFAVPSGILGSIICLVIGTIILDMNLAQASIMIPDFSASANIVSGSVIPSGLALSSNILSQWMVIAPSEESAFRVISPYALSSINDNPIFYFGLSILMWMGFHYPTWVMSGTNPNMYIVIVIWGIIFAGLLIITGNILSPMIAHASTNTSVLLLKGGTISPIYIFGILIILCFMGYVIWYLKEQGNVNLKGSFE